MNPKLKSFLIPRAASALMQGLYGSMRIRQVGVENIVKLNDAKQQYILAFWHRHLLLMVFAQFTTPLVVMISQHKDGEYIAKAVERFGILCARGSTTRGGSAALKEIVSNAAKGYNVAITPDGPKGPACEAQLGVVIAAKRVGIPIVPAALVSERKKVLSSWDRFEIPKPFSRAFYVYGEPITVPKHARGDDVEAWRKKIEDSINSLTTTTEPNFDEVWRSGVRMPMQAR